jgi:hypothetical protein
MRIRESIPVIDNPPLRRFRRGRRDRGRGATYRDAIPIDLWNPKY